MTHESRRKTLPETVRSTFNRPPVTVYVDFLNSDYQNGRMAKPIMKFADSIGRVDRAFLYGYFNFDTRENREDWKGYDVKIAEDGNEGSARLEMHLDILTSALTTERRIYVIVGFNAGLYIGLAKRLMSRGNTVVVVGAPMKQEDAQRLPFSFCSVETMMQGKSAPAKTAPEKLDVENYDFTQFIEVLNTSEQKMQFVAVSFFIRKVMWRLSSSYTDLQKQMIFNKAQEEGIIELFERDNIDKDAPPVSACKLNREHPLVVSVLERSAEEEEKEESSLSHRMDLSAFKSAEEPQTDATT